MLRWTQAEMEAADALPWDMPLASAIRPMSTRAIAQVSLAGIALFTTASLFSLGLVLTAPVKEALAHPTLNTRLTWFTLAASAALLVPFLALRPATWRRIFPAGFVTGILLPPVMISIGVFGAGPGFGDITAAFYIEAPLFAFYVCRLPWALLCMSVALSGYGAVLFLQDGWPQPFGRWCVIVTAVGSTAYVVGRIAHRAERLAHSEHEARVELADVNATLEARVETQVAEIEKLGELRRFLSPQVADALLSEQQDAVRRPHRARIAVFFCDLRGFTAFTNRAEPEEVVTALDEYYAVVGGLLQKYGATIGDYAGDGIMAYFGDPVPHPDPAGAALSMAHEVREPMARLRTEWRRLGHDLGYGVGVAYGYATLGVIGFDGRYDYSPIGGVVNLAARLCAKAGDEEVLLDHAALAAAEGRVQCEQVTDLDLKGYAADTRAYRLVGA